MSKHQHHVFKPAKVGFTKHDLARLIRIAVTGANKHITIRLGKANILQLLMLLDDDTIQQYADEHYQIIADGILAGRAGLDMIESKHEALLVNLLVKLDEKHISRTTMLGSPICNKRICFKLDLNQKV